MVYSLCRPPLRRRSPLIEHVIRITDELSPSLVADRRDFHRHAEPGWTEFRTASLVARRLSDLGWQVQLGREVLRDGDRMAVPPPDVLEQRWQRARTQGADPAYLDAVRGGFTGVVGTLRAGPGPTLAIRFDMDALEIQESDSPTHRPAREGFASVNPEATHACGHDGHTAIGLGIATLLAQLRSHLHGTVKLVFQPAEEGVCGAKAMVGAGVLDDVDWMLGQHLFTGGWPLGDLFCSVGGWTATEKFDAWFHGAPAHAGGSPQGGKNALLAAATAVVNLYALPRHGAGGTRVNVGRMAAGTARNIIAPHAHLLVETRGDTSELSDYMHRGARRVLEAAAAMYECGLEIQPMGSAPSAETDPALAERVAEVAKRLGGFRLHPPFRSGGSEDYTYMMQRVQQRGGQAASLGIGADLAGLGDRPLAHTNVYDFDERALTHAVRLLAVTTLDLLSAAQP
ncbi:MAG: M20 family metallo-hydrolase [Chloroflexi bacterium]|nr:M20 family metallo-hydrolase [Chloroflexota bacterium]